MRAPPPCAHRAQSAEAARLHRDGPAYPGYCADPWYCSDDWGVDVTWIQAAPTALESRPPGAPAEVIGPR